MPRSNALVFGVVLIASLMGCASSRNEECPWRTTSPLKRAALIDQISPEGVVFTEHVCVYYPKGTRPQAHRLAEDLEARLAHLHVQVGIRLVYKRINIFLKPVSGTENAMDLLTESGTFLEPGHHRALVLHVDPESRDDDGFLMDVGAYRHFFVSIVAEESVCDPESELPVTRDSRRRGPLGFMPARSYQTRWFRQGLALYCADFSSNWPRPAATQPVGRLHSWSTASLLPTATPMSSLHEIGEDLFTWGDLDAFPTGSPDGNYDHRYDAAFLGLFQFIERAYGRPAIKRWVERVNASDRLEGKNLLALTNEALGTDILARVKQYREQPASGT